ncbi:hypothetical protein JL720_851 [Aureococcus anophagefferens]|nr:hypothetical protein JL720_851 [Aureococcus anophagefferens]
MGKGHVVEAAEPFLSLPQSAVDELWRSFNLNTEGWGLNPAQFTRMLGALTQTLQLDDDAARDLYGKLFEVFDTDKNDLIDALEFLATIAAISGMDANKKMMFVFNLYDFSENGELMLDEVTLLMKSTVVGLSKISLDTPPSLKEFEALAKLALGCELSVDGKPVLENTATISRTKFVTYCDSNPTMSSWLAHYDDVGAPPAETAEKPAIADVASLVLAADATNFKKRVDKKEWLATKDVGLGDAPCEAAHVQLIPTEPPASVSTKPDSTLELSWVFGFGAPGVRMNCHYCATGAVAFHAAEVCVLQSVGTEEEGFKPRQEFFLDHGLSISALALSADGATLASGDGGDEAKVCVWDAATRESKAVFRGFHRGAVTVLDFSKCGKLLLSVDARDHLALWDLAAKSKVASFVLGKKTYAACFTAHSLCFVSCGADHVTFWMASGQDKYNFAPKAGLPGAAGKKARTYTCTTEAHVGAIAALHFTSGGTKTALLTTAGVDGKVKIFRADTLDILCQMDLATLPAVGSPVAVCLHPLGEKCLVGTTDGELYELAALSTVPPVPEGEEGGPPPVGSALGGGPLVRGPSGSGGLVALVASPSGAFFATAGKDRAVTVFDAESKKTLFREVLQSAPTSVCFSADNTSLLVGLEKGTALVFAIGDDFLQVQTLDPNPAPEVEEGAEPAEPAEPDPDAPPPAAVIDCKWASDGTIALACDDKVHFFTSTDYVLKGTAQVSGVVSKMDFAEGAPLLQVGTVDLDLAIISSEDASSPAPDAAKDVAWQTATCPVAYGYKGVVSSLYFATPADAGVVAAAPALGLCAVGDQFGSVDLLPYPCLDKSGFQSSAGHGPGLPTPRTRRAPPPDDDEEVVVDYKAEDDETLVDGIDLEIEDRSDKFKAVRGDVVAKLFELEDVDPEAEDAVDKFDATAPFKDTVVAPAAEPYLGPAVTNDDLVLDWVHGYAGQKMTSNVRYNVSGDVVYPAACVGIVLDKTKRSQRHMLRHTDVITATAMHPLGELCATAQVGDAPTVVVWNTLDGVVQRTFFLNAGSRACSALAFSADGKYLACAAQNDDHDVSVFDWDDGALARAGPTGGKKVLSMAFNAAGTKLVYGAVDSFGTVPACGWITSGEGVEEAVIGTASGGVFKLDGRAIGSGEKMHSGPVTSIFTCPVLPGAEDGPETSAVALVTGGYDGKVKLLTPELEMKMEFDLGRASSKTGVVLVVSTLKPSLEVVKELKDTTAAITCIKFSPDGEAMCAGAADMKIYVYDTLNNFVLKATCVGHTEPPRTLDFTENSASVMSCSSGPQFECVVHDAKSGDVQGDGLSEQANEPWDAWTSTIGWGVLGAYPAFSKTDDLTSCSRSFDKELLATSDDYGTVNLYRWPCVAPGAPAKTFVGHGPRVAMVRFTPKSDVLASAGETDRCLFQWSRKRNVGPEKASLDDEAAAALAASLAPVGLAPPPEAPEATWKDEVLPPSEDPTAVDAPERAPVLQFAYGVPTTKESVGYNAKGGVTYAAGRLVVAYDGKAHKQVFYEGCTKPISAFAVSADGAYCAAGEWDSVAPLKILDACTLVEVASLPPRLRGAMTRLAFSPCGKFVAAVGTGFGKAQTGGMLEKWTQKSAAYAGLVTRVACETAHGGGAACATATTENRCVTGGADGWVKVWATADLQILSSYFLGEAPHLCVGVGSGAPALDVDGRFVVLDVIKDEATAAYSLAKIAEGHNAKAHVTCAAYSPDGSVLALGSADNIVYLYTVSGLTPYELFAVFDKHDAPVLQLDFSADSKYVRAVSTSLQLLACSCLSGEEVPLNTLNDVAWATETVCVGYEKICLWPDEPDGDPVVATARRADTMASATLNGALKVQAYPCIDPDAAVVSVHAHGGPVSCLNYASDAALLSSGSLDSLVLKWAPTPAVKVELPPVVDDAEDA